jgi:hypothetical protein
MIATPGVAGPLQSVTSGKAGGMYCEPLKAVFNSWAT